MEATDDAMGRSRRAGDLSVNKKGTPLYSREDIREQYCINDKELQVLDKTGRKGILGCFSNNGQVSTVDSHYSSQVDHLTVGYYNERTTISNSYYMQNRILVIQILAPITSELLYQVATITGADCTSD